MELLRAENLSHGFDYPLFENLNISINYKDCISIQGSSGCGKSTLLHILSSLLKPNSGNVYFNNEDLYSLDYVKRNDILRNNFGIIFQTHYLFKGFSAYENIELSSILSSNDFDEKILKKLGIYDLLDYKIGKLSGGQQQRVSIARVLCKKPKVIFADEATGNLDFLNAKNVMDILLDYVNENNAALFFVTHDEKLANLCNKKYKINSNGIC